MFNYLRDLAAFFHACPLTLSLSAASLVLFDMGILSKYLLPVLLSCLMCLSALAVSSFCDFYDSFLSQGKLRHQAANLSKYIWPRQVKFPLGALLILEQCLLLQLGVKTKSATGFFTWARGVVVCVSVCGLECVCVCACWWFSFVVTFHFVIFVASHFVPSFGRSQRILFTLKLFTILKYFTGE